MLLPPRGRPSVLLPLHTQQLQVHSLNRTPVSCSGAIFECGPLYRIPVVFLGLSVDSLHRIPLVSPGLSVYSVYRISGVLQGWSVNSLFIVGQTFCDLQTLLHTFLNFLVNITK